MVIKIPVKFHTLNDMEMGVLEFTTLDNTTNNGIIYFNLDGQKVTMSEQDFNLLVTVVDTVKNGNKSKGFRTPC